MTQDVVNHREAISALADGQLRGTAFAHTVELLADSEDARASWHAYHLVGDVLRSEALAATSARDMAFVARLRQQLQNEAVVSPHHASLERNTDVARSARKVGHRPVGPESSNAASFRWKLVAGLASLAAVTVLGWQISSDFGLKASAPQLAQRAVPAAVSQSDAEARQPVMIRDPRLDQLLAAHQQFGGTSALQMPAGFLRNATFEKPAR